ncbi:MAG: tRNA-dihydrouridine synthase family protein [Clostridia bacterium]|nr:tRNA-dihydrouridine synthase family protein [Clostridia bacterium]MBO4797884.1 tRNA-dihydrouridine synthase family protein [Candidatus Methanomethylophilaceae archaeon]MBQ4289651.1 tRNA-dihydrouridine synthase family protein [Clostridia bacterium]
MPTVRSYYFAPLEGIADCYFRTIHASLFPNAKPDRYFAPFFTPTRDTVLSPRTQRELDPRNNRGLSLVPQILANDPERFLDAVRALSELGYREFNLNLGCPSGTVVSKGRGAGFLADPDRLDRFFDTLFSFPECRDAAISVKTRIGIRSAQEYPALLSVFCRYPISELIVHPRTREANYEGIPDLSCFLQTLLSFPGPVCYNGDVFCKADLNRLEASLPNSSELSLMLGRGLVSNPVLVSCLRDNGSLTREDLTRFSDALYLDARERLSGERHMLFRLKELWAYWAPLFDQETAKPFLSAIRKSKTMDAFRAATAALLSSCEPLPGAGYSGDGHLH